MTQDGKTYSFKDAQGAVPAQYVSNLGTEPEVRETVNQPLRTGRTGRKAPVHDPRSLKLAHYLTPQLPAPPTEFYWNKGVTEFGMMCNDRLGCCTIAGGGHAVQVFSLNAGSEVTVSDADILAYYKLWDGYVDGDPSTDNGGVELDVLKRWKAEEFAGHVLLAWADVARSNQVQVRQAIWLFGGLYIGMLIPDYLAEPIANGGALPAVWDVQKANAEANEGHCVFVVGYDADTLTFISWGALYKMSWAFWHKYVDEAHALLSKDFIAANGLDPLGFDSVKLEADLGCIR